VDDKEKIICLKNNKRVGLVNGMFISLHDIENIADPFNPDLESFGARIKGEEGEWFGNITRTGDGQKFQIYAGHFLDHIKFDKDRKDRDWSIVKKYVEATFGWVITVHKMQGSQAENIIVIDDKLFANKKLFRKQWLYTAITRAEEGLCIID
jgi:exodeoxyribonuclease-5